MALSDNYGHRYMMILFFFFQAEDGIRDVAVTGVQTCALPICEVPWTGRVCRCVWRFSAARVIGVHDSGRRRRPGALCLGVHQEPFPVHFQFRGRAILDSFGVLRFLLEVGGVVDLLLKQSSVHRDPLCSELMMTRPAPLGLD